MANKDEVIIRTIVVTYIYRGNNYRFFNSTGEASQYIVDNLKTLVGVIPNYEVEEKPIEELLNDINQHISNGLSIGPEEFYNSPITGH